jgi:hypothetical protein
VGKLAARHRVRVFLRPSPYGGTTAIVVLPRTMVTQEAETSTDDQPAEEIRGAGRTEELQLALTGRQMRRTAAAADDSHARLGVEPQVADNIPALPAVSAPGVPPARPAPRAGTPPAPSDAAPSDAAPSGAVSSGAVSSDASARREPSAAADTEITAAQPVFPAPPAVTPAEPMFPAPPAVASAGQASPQGFPAPPDSSRTQPSFFRLGTGPVLPPSATPAPAADQPASGESAPGQPAPGQPAAHQTGPGQPGPRQPAAGSAALPTRHGARNARPSLFQPRSGPPDLTGHTASPQAPGPAAQPSSPTQPAGSAQPSGGPAQPGPGVTAGTHRGLPRRVRQANLSPHLRTSGSAASQPTRGPEARSPEQAKSLLSSLQRGWERGREAEVPDSEATGGGQNAGGGARQASQEET